MISPQTVATKLKAHNYSSIYCRMSLKAVALQYPLTGIEGAEHVPARQCPCANTGSIKTWSAKTRMENLECPAQSFEFKPTKQPLG